MRAEHRRLGTTLLLTALACAPALAADEHIFEPGSKHVCVPAANGQGWDCRSAEEAPAAAASTSPREPRLRSSRQIPEDSATSAATADEPAAPTGPLPQPAPASTEGNRRTAPKAQAAAAPAAGQPAAAAAEPPAATPETAVSSRNVPHYLLSPEARGSAASASSAPTASAPARSAAAAEPVRATGSEAAAAHQDTAAARAEVTETAPTASATADPPSAAPATATSPAAATASAAAPSAAAAAKSTAATTTTPSTTATAPSTAAATKTAAATAAAQITADAMPSAAAETASAGESAPAQPRSEPPPTAPANHAGTLLGAGEFRRLSDTRYVVELASGASRGEVESRAASAAPAQGRVYLLPLRRDGADWYLAVWGDFDSVDAARSARAQALADGAAGLGWPRRAGPLKQELVR